MNYSKNDNSIKMTVCLYSISGEFEKTKPCKEVCGQAHSQPLASLNLD